MGTESFFFFLISKLDVMLAYLLKTRNCALVTCIILVVSEIVQYLYFLRTVSGILQADAILSMTGSLMRKTHMN